MPFLYWKGEISMRMRQNIFSELRTLNLWPYVICGMCVRDAASKKPPSFRQSLSSLGLGRKKRSACEPLLRRAQARQWCFWLRLSCHWPENRKREVSEQVDSNHLVVQWCWIENRIHCHLQFIKAMSKWHWKQSLVLEMIFEYQTHVEFIDPPWVSVMEETCFHGDGY